MKLARVVIALGVIILTAIAAIYFLSPSAGGPAAGTDDADRLMPVSPLGQTASDDQAQTIRRIQELSFFDQQYSMGVGEQLSAQVVILPEEHTEELIWRSSDQSVVSVDESGKLTALSTGSAVITVSSELCSAELSVSVTEASDWRQETLTAIAQLADGCGLSTVYIDAQLLFERLARSAEGSEEAAVLYELLDSVLDYSSGSGQRDRLYSAISAAGADQRTALTAAASCWAKHEMLTCDAVLSFAGDVTLARYNESGRGDRFPAVYASSGSRTYPFDRVRGIFTCDYMTVVNFEGVLTGSTRHRDKTFYFRGDPLYAGILPASSIEAVTLENNHSGDYYNTGFEDTVSYLTEAGVDVFYEESPLIIQTGGLSGPLRVVMLGFMHTGDSIPDKELGQMLSMIRQHDTSDTVVVVNIHWGVEGETTPTASQQTAAHAMIDAGADLIVGHHPHIMQGIECYNGRYIAYSLGNFAFGGNASAGDPETFILRAHIGSEGGGPAVTGISVVPCLTTSSGTSRNNYQPCMLFGAEAQEGIDLLSSRSARLKYGIDSADWSGI